MISGRADSDPLRERPKRSFRSSSPHARRRNHTIPRAADPRHGFTLIEMLLVLAVLVALTALGIGSLVGMDDSQRLPRLADDLRGLFAGLRVRSMESGQTHQWAYKPNTSDWLVRASGQSSAADESVVPQPGPLRYDLANLLGPHRLENNVVFVPPVQGATATPLFVSDLVEAGYLVFEFRPDGSSDDIEVALADAEGFGITLRVNGRTGKATATPPFRLANAPTSNRGQP